MKVKSLTILLFAILAVSSLKSVWSYEGVDINELDDQAVDINEAEELVNELDELDESDLFDASEEAFGRRKRTKCRLKTPFYTRVCMEGKCTRACRFIGFRIGICNKFKPDRFIQCYCEKPGKCTRRGMYAPTPGHAHHSPPHDPEHAHHSPPHDPEHTTTSPPADGPESVLVL